MNLSVNLETHSASRKKFELFAGPEKIGLR